METGKEKEPVFLERSSRLTRGNRLNKLLNEEAEEDELFWNQDALKEEEDDKVYEEEVEVADVFDSDFDSDEPEPDEEEEKEPDDRERKKKRVSYPGMPVTKKKKKKKVLSSLEGPLADEKSTEQSTLPERQDMPDDVEVERIVRKSTRTSVVVRQAERDAIRAALQATMKPIKRRKEGEEKRMTQEEMLLEAAQTGHSYLEFSNGVSFESEIATTSEPYPEKAVCAVTGLPAKYRDPKTGLPYAMKEAFQIICKRFSDESSSGRQKESMGVLYDLISGQGFSERRKRSMIPDSRETSYLRFSRFRSIPALEILDLE
ncbi:hypothetical protein RJ639_045838 [Escallonia herrerae]|uniref:Vps72/YL1 C-terminal domain-containing protein n=1 Tax=Escallonia herrerae TaxID=1293975 RepID=A0AA88W5M5_9ASTE|nr:hypothetical protein RJ639_045838 [Escallonia herrerae]